MKHLILMLIVIGLIVGCAALPKSELLVRYPIKGEIVKLYYQNNKSTQHFIIDYEELINFLNKINQKEE